MRLNSMRARRKPLTPAVRNKPAPDKASAVSIQSDLSNASDWPRRAAALDAISASLNTAQATKLEYAVFAPGIASCITDHHSSLVRSASLLIAACAQTLRDRFLSSVPIIIPALFKPLMTGSSITCHLAIIEVVKNVQHRKTIAIVLEYATSKSREQRLVVAESLTVVFQDWPDGVVQTIVNEAQKAAKLLSRDVAPDVSRAAKLAWRRPMKAEAPAEKTVKFVEFLVLPEETNLEKPKSIMKHSKSVDRPKTIESFMPPLTKSDAEAFARCLAELVEANSLDRLSSSESFLVDSIVEAAAFIPKFSHWEPLVRPLFDRFPDAFIEDVHNILTVFQFDSNLIAIILQAFEWPKIVKHFSTLPPTDEAVIFFFASTIKLGYEFTLTYSFQTFLNAVVKNCLHPKEVNVIRRYLAKHADPIVELIDKINSVGNFEVESFELIHSGRLDGREQEIERCLLPILIGESETARANCLSVIAQMQSMSFKNLRNSLLDGGGGDREILTACLAKMLDNDLVLTEMLESVVMSKDKAQQILAAMLRYVSEAPNDRMIAVMPRIFNAISNLMGCEVITVRRLVLLIFVQFRMKAHQEFLVYSKTVSPAHQRLIEMYTARCSKVT
jgi:hypothetical protein